MSASHGGSSSPSDTASENRNISSAPCRCAISAACLTSSTIAEKIWRLEDHRRRLVVNLAFEIGDVEAAGLRIIAELLHRHALMLRVSL